jgi:hypothetical protein
MQFLAKISRRLEKIQAPGGFSKFIGEESPSSLKGQGMVGALRAESRSDLTRRKSR